MTRMVFQHAMVGIDVFEVTGEVSRVRIGNVAGVRRAFGTTTTVDDVIVAAHEITGDEEDEGKDEGGEGGVGSSRILCQKEIEVVVDISRQEFDNRLCKAV